MMGVNGIAGVDSGAAAQGAKSAVWLVEDAPAGGVAAGEAGGVAWTPVVAGAALIAAGIAMWRVQRKSRGAPEDRAFRWLCFRMRLGVAERRTVKRLAERAKAEHPVALLLSEHSFRKAAGAAGMNEERTVQKVARKVFSRAA